MNIVLLYKASEGTDCIIDCCQNFDLHFGRDHTIRSKVFNLFEIEASLIYIKSMPHFELKQLNGCESLNNFCKNEITLYACNGVSNLTTEDKLNAVAYADWLGMMGINSHMSVCLD